MDSTTQSLNHILAQEPLHSQTPNPGYKWCTRYHAIYKGLDIISDMIYHQNHEVEAQFLGYPVSSKYRDILSTRVLAKIPAWVSSLETPWVRWSLSARACYSICQEGGLDALTAAATKDTVAQANVPLFLDWGIQRIILWRGPTKL